MAEFELEFELVYFTFFFFHPQFFCPSIIESGETLNCRFFFLLNHDAKKTPNETSLSYFSFCPNAVYR